MTAAAPSRSAPAAAKWASPAAAQGVTGAGMVLLWLPGEVRDVFREWLLRHHPDRVKHVLGLVREARNGRDNDPNFHTRFKGEGAYAVLLQQRFEGIAPARAQCRNAQCSLQTIAWVIRRVKQRVDFRHAHALGAGY